jgi:hypothetical protein
MGGMNTNRLGLGLTLTLVGGVLIFIAFVMNTGDAMFGGITQKAPIAILGVVLFVNGAAQIVRGLRDHANARNHSILVNTPSGRQSALLSLLADIDQQLVEAEALAAAPGNDDTLQRARPALIVLRESRQDVEAKLNSERNNEIN